MPEDTRSPNQRNVDAMRSRMDGLQQQFNSCTFCTAKWLQSTVTLYNGHTHSCHHPSPHKVPLEELSENPTALHNTRHKKQAREEMLRGERPSECGYCWTVEDLPGNHFSDRTYKSADPNWSTPYTDRIAEAGAQGDVMPSYLEVAFDSTCNFKCAYCSPDVSSKWMEEIQQHGHYPTSWGTGNLDWLKQTGRYPIPQNQQNPYVDAFWRWWPLLYPSLHTFRLTGGEPLLSKNTWRVLDSIGTDPRADLTLAINSNFDVPDALFTRFIGAYRSLAPRLREFQVFTSCEAHGADAEYTRFGMDYRRFIANIERFLTETGPKSRVGIMVTFNALSVPSFTRFLSDVYDLRCRFNPDDAENRVPIMISYLRWPPFLGARVLPREIREEAVREYRDFVSARTRNTSANKAGRFYIEEIDQIERLGEFMLGDDPDLVRNQADFLKFTEEYDKRKGTDFDATFPTLSAFRASLRSG
jgi:hypothetical protein